MSLTGCSEEAGKHPIVFHDWKQVMRRQAGLYVAGVVILLVLIPFLTAAIPGDSIFDILTTHEQMKFRLIHPNYVRAVCAALLCLAFAYAVFGFGFLTDKKQTTWYFSVGLTRRQLFLIRYLTGAVGLFLAVLLPLMVSFAINQVALGGYPGMGRTLFYLLAGLYLQTMMAYTLTVLACILSGTAAELVLHALLFLGGFAAVFYSISRIFENMIWGNAAGAYPYGGTDVVSAGLMDLAQQWNPVFFFYLDASRYAMFYRGLEDANVPEFEGRYLFFWLLLLLVLLLVAAAAIRGRKAEQAGMSGGCFPLTMILLLAGAFCLYVNVLVLFFGSSKLLGIIAGILAVFLYILLWKTAYLRKIFLKKQQVVCSAIVLVGSFLACTLIAGVGTLVKNRIPDPGSALAVEISFAGNPSCFYEEMKGSSSGSTYYISGTWEEQLADGRKNIAELHQKLQKSKKQTMGRRENFAESVVPYDVQISWKMENGNTRTWYYDRASLGILEEMLRLEESDTVKNGIASMISDDMSAENSCRTMEAYQEGEVYLTDIWYSHPCRLELTGESRQKLLDALAADLEGQDIQDRYFPEKQAEGILYFSTAGEEDTESFAWHPGSAEIHLTKAFTQTLSFLESHGLKDYISDDAKPSGIVLQEYDPSGGTVNVRTQPASNIFLSYRADSLDAFVVQSDFGSKQAIVDPARLAEMIPRLRATYSMTRPGYLAAVQFEDSGQYVYMYLPGDI